MKPRRPARLGGMNGLCWMCSGDHHCSSTLKSRSLKALVKASTTIAFLVAASGMLIVLRALK